uniref:Matrix-remodelling associated 5b n=1 Tax=Cyprinus carpio TaxID=7962 RepID=A0A8C2F989_CYPCA
MGDDYVLLKVNVMMKAAKIDHKSLSDHKVSYGGELKVDCIASGLPNPEITNVAGIDKKVIHIEVLVSTPVINGLESQGVIRKTVVKDQRVLLDCNANGNPVPRIMWVFPNNIVLPAPYYGSRITVHRNGTLDIHAVRISDSVALLCIARNEGGEAKLQVQLEVTEGVEKPRLRSSPTESIQLTNGILSLNCSIEGKPMPEITWILPNGTSLLRGTSVFRFHHQLDGTLVIRDPSILEVGRYRCIGRNSAGYVERTVMLESNRKPEITNKYSSLVSIINGENLHLNCLSGGHPLPRLTWTLPNGVILTRPTSVYDRGMYLCQTTNEHGSSSLSLYLTHFTMIKLIGDINI